MKQISTIIFISLFGTTMSFASDTEKSNNSTCIYAGEAYSVGAIIETGTNELQRCSKIPAHQAWVNVVNVVTTDKVESLKEKYTKNQNADVKGVER